MGFLARFFSSYSESFTAAVLAWPFASFALTLPILALLYHRDGRIRLLSAAGAYLSVLYLLGIVCFTLYPLPEGDSGPVRFYRRSRPAARRACVGCPGLSCIALYRDRPAHWLVRYLSVRVPYLRDHRPGHKHARRFVRVDAGKGVVARPA